MYEPESRLSRVTTNLLALWFWTSQAPERNVRCLWVSLSVVFCYSNLQGLGQNSVCFNVWNQFLASLIFYCFLCLRYISHLLSRNHLKPILRHHIHHSEIPTRETRALIFFLPSPSKHFVFLWILSFLLLQILILLQRIILELTL